MSYSEDCPTHSLQISHVLDGQEQRKNNAVPTSPKILFCLQTGVLLRISSKTDASSVIVYFIVKQPDAMRQPQFSIFLFDWMFPTCMQKLVLQQNKKNRAKCLAVRAAISRSTKTTSVTSQYESCPPCLMQKKM